MVIFSVKNHNASYKKDLGDGDSKAFATADEQCVYGPDITVEKLECTGHVQKRMGNNSL